MAAVATENARPAPTPWTPRNTTSASIDGAAALAALPTRKKAIVARNVARTPNASMTGPATIVARVEVTRKPVITQLSSATSPSSAVIWGNAATTARMLNAVSEMVATTVLVSESHRFERMVSPAAATGPL